MFRILCDGGCVVCRGCLPSLDAKARARRCRPPVSASRSASWKNHTQGVLEAVTCAGIASRRSPRRARASIAEHPCSQEIGFCSRRRLQKPISCEHGCSAIEARARRGERREAIPAHVTASNTPWVWFFHEADLDALTGGRHRLARAFASSDGRQPRQTTQPPSHKIRNTFHFPSSVFLVL